MSLIYSTVLAQLFFHTYTSSHSGPILYCWAHTSRPPKPYAPHLFFVWRHSQFLHSPSYTQKSSNTAQVLLLTFTCNFLLARTVAVLRTWAVDGPRSMMHVWFNGQIPNKRYWTNYTYMEYLIYNYFKYSYDMHCSRVISVISTLIVTFTIRVIIHGDIPISNFAVNNLLQ